MTENGIDTSDASFGFHWAGQTHIGNGVIDWDAVFAAVKRCHEVVHELGAPRISTTLRVGTRTDRVQTMGDKIRSVADKLQQS